MAEPAIQLDTCSTSAAQGEGAFYLAAVSEGGEAYVWRCGPQGEGVEAQLLAQVRVAGATSGAGGLMAVKLQQGPEGGCRWCQRLCDHSMQLRICAMSGVQQQAPSLFPPLGPNATMGGCNPVR